MGISDEILVLAFAMAVAVAAIVGMVALLLQPAEPPARREGLLALVTGGDGNMKFFMRLIAVAVPLFASSSATWAAHQKCNHERFYWLALLGSATVFAGPAFANS